MHERFWVGRVSAGRQDEHDQFVAWLAGAEGAEMFRRYRLTSYQLRDDDGSLGITLGTAEPIAIIHFLRNPSAWPEFWRFQSNAASDMPAGGEIRVSWKRDHENETG
jgi:hypothetical protein